MNPEHDGGLRLGVAILELLQTFSWDCNVQIQTIELVISWSWVIRPSTDENFSLFLDASRTETGSIKGAFQ
jgi:hypothetical protein